MSELIDYSIEVCDQNDFDSDVRNTRLTIAVWKKGEEIGFQNIDTQEAMWATQVESEDELVNIRYKMTAIEYLFAREYSQEPLEFVLNVIAKDMLAEEDEGK